MAEAIAEVEAMDSMSRAGPNLHYEDDWTYRLIDSPLKRLYDQDPQTQTGEWLLSNETKNCRRQKTNFIVIPGSLRFKYSGISGENPKKEQIMAGRPPQNGAKYRPVTKRLSDKKPDLKVLTIGGTSKPLWTLILRRRPPPPTIHQEEKIKPKDKGLHSTTQSKVLTNPKTRSKSRKVKEVMSGVGTREVARSSACQRM